MTCLVFEAIKANKQQPKRIMKKLLALAAALVFAATVYAAEVPDISIDDLKKAIESKKVVLIDANDSESWQKGHIPGAVHWDATKEKLASVLPKEKDALVVAYCGGPKCKAYQKAANAAKDLGYN